MNQGNLKAVQLIQREVHVVLGRGGRGRGGGRPALGDQVWAAQQSAHVAVQHVPQHLRKERVPELLRDLQITLILISLKLVFISI